ncbi:hypothetical protein [Labrys sp. WJW]|nr:hypothetical protein [Labrys sp. WJW]
MRSVRQPGIAETGDASSGAAVLMFTDHGINAAVMSRLLAARRR